jgi:hypothetical protein
MQIRLHRRACAGALALAASVALCFAAPALAAPRAHGQLADIVRPGLKVQTNQSSNWFGYNQGSLEQGGKLFNSVAGDWTVPAATQHTAGQAEASSDWIGIGGGCVDAGCTVGDNTLIQTGTEQDVSATGAPSYGAWWEIIPGPSLNISNMTVHAGDQMHADITEAVAGSNVWKITLTNRSTGQTFSQTVPYSSTHATAEWIEETPLEIGTDAGFSALPNLTRTTFSAARTNGATAALKASEEMQLIDSAGNVIGTPSAPNGSGDGFGLCAWATSC